MPLTLTPLSAGSLSLTAAVELSLDELFPHVGLYPRVGLYPSNSAGLVPVSAGSLTLTPA